MCRQCGREFAAPEGDLFHVCPSCAGVPEIAEQKLSNAGARAILMAVLTQITPVVFVTYALLATNVLVFLAMAVSGVALANPAVADLLKWGATYGPYTMNGEWWRLLSSTFVHAGIIHLGFNMFVLLDLGVVAERLLGKWRFLLLYLSCGMSGSLASLWWHPMVVGVGASGAIFGIAGACASALYFSKLPIPRLALQKEVTSLMIFIGYNVFYGLAATGIDNAAHAGGLLAGLIIGRFLPVALPRGPGDQAAPAL